MDSLLVEQVTIRVNREKSVYCVDLIGSDGTISLGFENLRQLPTLGRMTIWCGGFLEEGEFGKCFIAREAWNFFLLLKTRMGEDILDIEEPITGLDLRDLSIAVITKSEAGDTSFEIPYYQIAGGENESETWYTLQLKVQLLVAIVS